MYFKSLQISEWQQIQHLSIEFHPRLTILTGANGCGKTTVLNILAKHFGWDQPLLATPLADKSTGIVNYIQRLFKGRPKPAGDPIGTLSYSDGTKATLTIPHNNSATYALSISDQRGVKCFFIPSHRSVFRYQQITQIPLAKKDRTNAFHEISNSMRNRYFGNNDQSTSFYMKQALIGWMIHGYGVKRDGAQIMPSDAQQVQHFEGFEEVLRKVLPKTLGFQRLEVRNMEVVFVCNNNGDHFVLETSSGGISSLIDIAWQIYMFATEENSDFTVLIDEVENHLHPTLQRRLLQDLTDAFPRARFVVSTHSPLVVGSVKESSVYALRYNSEGKVESMKLDFQGKPKTASEVLDEVLGVSFTMPVWVEEKLIEITNRYRSKEPNEEYLTDLRDDLKSIGLERLLLGTMATLLEERRDD